MAVCGSISVRELVKYLGLLQTDVEKTNAHSAHYYYYY